MYSLFQPNSIIPSPTIIVSPKNLILVECWLDAICEELGVIDTCFKLDINPVCPEEYIYFLDSFRNLYTVIVGEEE